MLNHMDMTGAEIATPKGDQSVQELTWLDFSSGYVQRALDVLPKQGASKPWKLYQNYALDMLSLRFCKVVDGTMKFELAHPVAAIANAPEAIAAE